MRGIRDAPPTTIADVKCIHATDRAILVVIGDEQHWVPQSQVHDDSEVFAVGDEGKLVVTAWFAQKLGH